MVRIFPFAAVRPVRNAAPQVAAVPYDAVTADEARSIIRDNPMSFYVSAVRMPKLRVCSDRSCGIFLCKGSLHCTDIIRCVGT